MEQAAEADQGVSRRSELGAAVMFWLLLAVAVATFTPCVLLPELRHLQALRMAEAAEQLRVDRMRQRVAGERRLLEAMTSDPNVVARIARRDLRYRAAGEAVVPLGDGSEELRGVRAIPVAGVAPDLPLQPVASGKVWPDVSYDRVFCNKKTRPIIMAMSIALAGAALILYGTRDATAEGP